MTVDFHCELSRTSTLVIEVQSYDLAGFGAPLWPSVASSVAPTSFYNSEEGTFCGHAE